MNTKIIYPISSQSHIYTGDVFREIYLTRSSSQSYKEQSHCSRFASIQKNTNKKKREVLSNFSSSTRSRSKVATKVASSRGHLFGADRRSSNELLMSAQPQIKVSIAAAVNSLAKREGVASV